MPTIIIIWKRWTFKHVKITFFVIFVSLNTKFLRWNVSLYMKRTVYARGTFMVEELGGMLLNVARSYGFYKIQQELNFSRWFYSTW